LKHTVHIGLGANEGAIVESLNWALDSLHSLERSTLVTVSPIYRTAPIEAPGPDFLNAVVKLDTSLDPYSLLLHLLDIELVAGRKRSRTAKNAARRLDLDLLLFGDFVIQSSVLTVPHPRMHQRAFVLRPLLDLVPDIFIPCRGRASVLIERLADQRVEPFTIPTQP
jgi:2-amino-4-hydroxy-6-hydroxymethyldihydropteridine diphosphokinase